MIEGGVLGQTLAGQGTPVPRLHHGLAQPGDPLLLVEGVVGLQAVGLAFTAAPAAHTETVPHCVREEERERERERETEKVTENMEDRRRGIWGLAVASALIMQYRDLPA